MIPSGSALALFCLASVALAVVPGPAVTHIFVSGGIFIALGVTAATASRVT